jgi:hypothetical protein
MLKHNTAIYVWFIFTLVGHISRILIIDEKPAKAEHLYGTKTVVGS